MLADPHSAIVSIATKPQIISYEEFVAKADLYQLGKQPKFQAKSWARGARPPRRVSLRGYPIENSRFAVAYLSSVQTENQEKMRPGFLRRLQEWLPRIRLAQEIHSSRVLTEKRSRGFLVAEYKRDALICWAEFLSQEVGEQRALALSVEGLSDKLWYVAAGAIQAAKVDSVRTSLDLLVRQHATTSAVSPRQALLHAVAQTQRQAMLEGDYYTFLGSAHYLGFGVCKYDGLTEPPAGDASAGRSLAGNVH